MSRLPILFALLLSACGAESAVAPPPATARAAESEAPPAASASAPEPAAPLPPTAPAPATTSEEDSHEPSAAPEPVSEPLPPAPDRAARGFRVLTLDARGISPARVRRALSQADLDRCTERGQISGTLRVRLYVRAGPSAATIDRSGLVDPGSRGADRVVSCLATRIAGAADAHALVDHAEGRPSIQFVLATRP